MPDKERQHTVCRYAGNRQPGVFFKGSISNRRREITLENLSPVFTPEQEAAKRRELEQQLYEVFRKYADKRQKEEAGV